MIDHIKQPRVTLNDVQLAAVYYPILVDLARHKHRLTYGELVARAKQENDESPLLDSAIPVSTGRKLNVVRAFTEERKLPDLTSLIINKSDGECGTGFTSSFDPEEKRAEVFAFDWSGVSTEFDMFINLTEKKAKPKKARKKEEAIKLMSDYYFSNKKVLPKNVVDFREEIVSMLMEGMDVEQAYEEAVC